MKKIIWKLSVIGTSIILIYKWHQNKLLHVLQPTQDDVENYAFDLDLYYDYNYKREETFSRWKYTIESTGVKENREEFKIYKDFFNRMRARLVVTS